MLISGYDMLIRSPNVERSDVQWSVEGESGQNIHPEVSSELTSLLHRLQFADSLPIGIIEAVSSLLEWIDRIDNVEGKAPK